MAGNVTFTPTRDDYINACRAFFVREVRSWRFARRMLVWSGVAALAVSFILVVLGEQIVSAIAIGILSAFCGLLAGIMCVGTNFLLLARRAGRLYEQQHSLHEETKFNWSDSGTLWTSGRGTNQFLWVDYHRWMDARTTFLIYLNEGLYHFVPRRVLDEAQAQDLHGTLTSSGLMRR